jgi:hypothetical protein
VAEERVGADSSAPEDSLMFCDQKSVQYTQMEMHHLLLISRHTIECVECETIKYTCMHSAEQKRASLTCTQSEYEKSLSLSEKEGWKIDVCMLYINQVIVPLRGGARRKNYTVCVWYMCCARAKQQQ